MAHATDFHVVAPAPHELTKLLASDEMPTENKRNFAGLAALGALIWSWVLQAEASQGLQAAIEFNKPFFIVCFNHTAPVVLLPLIVGFFWFRGEQDRFASFDFVGVLGRHSVIPLTKLWKISAFLSTFYCVTDYFWYSALANVSVAAGVTLVVMFQNGSGLDDIASTGVVAGLMVVLSAALYGGYEVAIRLMLGKDITDTTTILIMTGLCGLFTIPLWIIGSLMLVYSPVEALYEPLGVPDNLHGLVLLIATGLMAIVFCISLPLSLCWTSPLETSVGCMMTIPLAGLVDSVIHQTSFSWGCIAGSALVMGGFGILEYCSAKDTLPQPDLNKVEDANTFA